FSSDPKKADERNFALRVINNLIDDYLLVYNEVASVTGKPSITREQVLNDLLEITRTSITDIITGMQEETRKRLEQKTREQESETWKQRIEARLNRLKGTAEKKGETEEEKNTREKREQALTLVKDLIKDEPEFIASRELAIERLRKITSNLDPGLLELLGDSDNAPENLLRIIRGESLLEVCGKEKIDDFIEKTLSSENGIIGRQIKSKKDEISKIDARIKELESLFTNQQINITEEIDNNSGKTRRTTLGPSEQQIQANFNEREELKKDRKELQQAIESLQKQLENLRDYQELRRHILSLVGFSLEKPEGSNTYNPNLAAYPEVKRYLEMLETRDSRETQLKSKLGALEIGLDKQENNGTKRPKTLAELRTELEKTSGGNADEIAKLEALKTMFSEAPEKDKDKTAKEGEAPEKDETNVISSIYARFEKTQEEEIPPFESEVWEEGEARVVYILFGEKYLEPTRHNISAKAIEQIHALIKSVNLNNPNNIRSLFDTWEKDLLKITRPSQNQQNQNNQQQPGGKAGGAASSP
ncbi:MAG: hypothetical protein N3E37_05870, partial [Candidatus Micrarchaeota archaeon]|nr:hypothetical protein [Candidatus Micrarchaeota archaeon]